MLLPANDLDIGRIGGDNLRAAIGIEQILALEVVKISLAIVAIANQAPRRVVGKCLEPGAEFSTLTLYFHGEVLLDVGSPKGPNRFDLDDS